MCMKIAVIDFESRYTKDVLDNLTQLNVEHCLFKYDVEAQDVEEYDAFIFTGSYDTVYAGGRLPHPSIMKCNKPILGICYGHQIMHYLLGGQVRKSNTPEHDFVDVNVEDSLLFKNLPKTQKVKMAHNDEVSELAPGFKCIASEDNCRYAASENVEKKIYTVQFHPEAKGNDYGKEIFMNFLDIVKN